MAEEAFLEAVSARIGEHTRQLNSQHNSKIDIFPEYRYRTLIRSMHGQHDLFRLTTILKLLRSLLRPDLTELLTFLIELVHHSKFFAAYPGIYEVLEHDAQLDLQDPSGKVAVYSKRQRVRFLQDNVIAYQDQAWGDGDIFANYQCSPGVAVDRYREGHRYRVLISLRETKNAGDMEEFFIQRTIKEGFVQETEDLQTEIDHRTHRLTVSVTFPSERPPKSAILIEQHTKRTTPLGAADIHILPNGRYQVTWRADKPRLFEAYIVRWVW